MLTTTKQLNIMAWGTYDIGKPRVRILLRGLRENKVSLTEVHQHVWKSIEDKSQINGLYNFIKIIVNTFAAYPSLIYQLFRHPRPDVILLPYFGYLDILLLWPLAKIRNIPIVLDAFIPIYDTVVNDRKMLSKFNPIAWLIWAWEWLVLNMANGIIFDTQAHQRYFCQTFGVNQKKCGVVYVGVEPEFFKPALTEPTKDSTRTTVLFYGQFIPLHGIETIIEAAQLCDDDSIEWVIIGTGQEAPKIQNMLDEKPVKNLQWIKWVNYEELNNWINKADICLGIFGKSDKANRVIPNKVFQMLASGKPLITRESEAIHEVLSNILNNPIKLVEANNPNDLLNAIYLFITPENRKKSCKFEGSFLFEPNLIVKPFLVNQDFYRE